MTTTNEDAGVSRQVPADMLHTLAASVTPGLMGQLTAETEQAYEAWIAAGANSPAFTTPRDTLLKEELSSDLYAVHAEAMRRMEAEMEALHRYEIAEVKRHLPFLAPVIQWAFDHVTEARPPAATCCMGKDGLGAA